MQFGIITDNKIVSTRLGVYFQEAIKNIVFKNKFILSAIV